MIYHALGFSCLVAKAAAFATAPFVPQNPCEGTKPHDAQFTDAAGNLDDSRTIPGYFDNKNCADMIDTGYRLNLPQSGMDVTDDGSFGDVANSFDPIMENYNVADPKLCPVNVHWHMGAEHRSAGEYDESGTGPHPYDGHHSGQDQTDSNGDYRRKLAGGEVRQGLLCHHYDATDLKFTQPYDWEHCEQMEVGQTYEIHWPHSAAGACGTQWQYQTPFYDGVFCRGGIISIGDNPPFNVHKTVGVQGQVFTIVNSDEPEYQYDHLFQGAWMDTTHWADVAKYTGSTTGTTRDNEVCSFYSPITWQVDRKCHMISAASWDKMCADMKGVATNGGDDMSSDLHPHGSRELVNATWSSDTVYRRK